MILSTNKHRHITLDVDIDGDDSVDLRVDRQVLAATAEGQHIIVSHYESEKHDLPIAGNIFELVTSNGSTIEIGRDTNSDGRIDTISLLDENKTTFEALTGAAYTIENIQLYLESLNGGTLPSIGAN